MSKKSYLKLIAIQVAFIYSAVINANVMSPSAEVLHNRDSLIVTNNLDKDSPLWRHVQFFADKNSMLSRDSMKPPHDALGITENVEIKMSAILNMLDRRQLSYTVDNLVPIFNPASSGIWDTNGHFIEEKFNQLAALAILDNGNQIITKDIFNHFLQSIPRDGAEKGVAASVPFGPFVVDITWEQVTTGSVNELFEFLGDYTFKNNGKEEKAFTVHELRRFYEYPDEYMVEVIHKGSNNAPLKTELCPYKH